MNGANRSAREAARAFDEEIYQQWLEVAAAKEPMPFQFWASRQPSGRLLTKNAVYLAVRLDRVYGGPAIVDRFFERGLKHIVREDICRAPDIGSHFDVYRILEKRTLARREITRQQERIAELRSQAASRSGKQAQHLEQMIEDCRLSIEQTQNEVTTILQEQADLARKSGLLRLTQQYADLIWSY